MCSCIALACKRTSRLRVMTKRCEIVLLASLQHTIFTLHEHCT